MTILLGLLRMPIDLWDNDEADKIQRHSIYNQAADLIETLEDENKVLKEAMEGYEKDCDEYEEIIDKAEPKQEEYEKDAERWNALLNSNRIRFLGSARLGKKADQVLCVEFHSDGSDSEKEHYNTEFAKERLFKYTDTLINNPLDEKLQTEICTCPRATEGGYMVSSDCPLHKHLYCTVDSLKKE